MKNKFFIFLVFLLILNNFSYAEQFKFETSKIEFADNGNLINAEDGKALSSDENIEINAKIFKYEKNTNLLKAFDGIAYYKSENLEIEFDNLTLDQDNSTTTATNNVKIFDLNKKMSIESDLIIFDKKKNILKSSMFSKMIDKNKNFLSSDSFRYNINNGILKLENAYLKDVNNNSFNIEFAFFDTTNSKLIGKDITVNLNNQTFDKENEPRIKGTSITYQDDLTEITNGVFTTCKQTDSCPPWQLSAKKIQHDSQKQIINYKNALLKVYDIPVMYFPKFFHPDPTVKRKSGFLIPTIKNSPNSNSYLSVPYYSVLGQNKDITLTPRFFSDDKFLIQTEFRQVNENSRHETDLSFFNEDNENSKTHFFYNYDKLFNFAYFEDSALNFKVEKTSNDTYLRANNLKSPLIKNYNILENILGLDLYSENLSINSEVKVYENLDKNSNDRYEFILPKLNLIKRFESPSSLDGNFLIKSSNFIRSYSTNILEKVNINDFIFSSNPKISKLGFYNNYDFIIKNVNSDSANSKDYQENEKVYVSGIFQYNSSLPLVKERNNFLNIIKPKMAIKLSPEHTKDLSHKEGNRLDVNNVFNINRLSSNNTIEGGASLAFGADFSIFDKKKSRDLFEIKLANNLRLEENDDLPQNNQIGSKTSNFFGEILFSPNENITTSYATSTRNNLTDINYENFNTEIKINNFVTTFDYLNENNTSNKSSYLSNSTKYAFNDVNSIKFSTRENKSSNLTEYYNLIYEYKNDCLSASIEYNKDYYDDRDIKPEENIFLKLTIIPFGETSSPNIKN